MRVAIVLNHTYDSAGNPSTRIEGVFTEEEYEEAVSFERSIKTEGYTDTEIHEVIK